MVLSGPVLGSASLRRFTRLTVLLIAVDFLDELASGIPFVGAPGIQRDLGISYGQAAGWVLTSFGLLALVLEPPLFLLADRYPRRFFVCGGLLAEGLICLLAGFAPGFGTLLVAVALYGPASGVGVGLAQATLMDAHPDDRERILVRWTLSGSLGDLATPALFSALALVAWGWREAFWIVAVLWLVWAVLVFRAPFPERVQEDDAPEPGMLDALRSAFATPALRPWVIGALLCNLMDETLVGFGALYLRDGLGADVHGRSLVLGAFMAGDVLGLLGLEPLLRRYRPMPMLAALSLGSAAAYAGWLLAPNVAWSVGFALLVGLFTGGHYPLAKAQAYRALPDRSGTVNAVMTLAGAAFLPVPVLLGVAADGVGLRLALGLLMLQPLGLLVIALLAMRRGRLAAS